MKKIEAVGLTDFDMSLDDMIIILQALRIQYGGDAVLSADAGHNNVQVFITVEEEDEQVD